MDKGGAKGVPRAHTVYPAKEGQRYINPTLATFFFSSHPKRERDQEAHLNYYGSAYNRGRLLSHHKTKSNTIKISMHP